MKIAMSSGHGKYIRGASGYIDEVDEARLVVESVADVLRGEGHIVVTFHDDISDDQSENLNRIVNWHNAQSRELDVSVHFNAYQTTSSPMGTEVLYVTQSTLAAAVSDKIATAADLPDRGAKYRSDLFFLNSTDKPAILIEVCFVDSSTDASHYKGNYDAICHDIAEGILGQELDDTEPPEPPEPPRPVEPPSMDNRVDILGHVEGDVAIVINGSNIRGNPARCRNVVRMRIKMTGDVVVSINGQDFHNEAPPEAPPVEVTGPAANHTDIETTVFGGASDPNNSAYPPYGYLNDSDLYVALPYSFPSDLFPDNPPKVRVYHGELSAVGAVADKGPWTTDDEAYVKGTARPIAETCYENRTPLPSGPNAGEVPTNRAGLDLSPALAEKVGLEGKGLCSWEFVED